MTIEQLHYLPSTEKLLDEIKDYELGDSFGEKIMKLDDTVADLEKDGRVKGWRTRLLVYELNRRWTWFKQIKNRTGRGAEYADGAYAITELTPAYFDRLRRPAKMLTWDNMLDKIQGKTVRFGKGSFRTIPTPAHIDFLDKGFNKYRHMADVNMVMYDPSENIRRYKDPNSIIFPDILRREFLRHVLSVDIVVKIPKFGNDSPETFWRKRGQELKERAAKITILSATDDKRMYFHKQDDTGIELSIDSTAWPPRYSIANITGGKDPEVWATRDWDKISDGHEYFIEAAMKILT